MRIFFVDNYISISMEKNEELETIPWSKSRWLVLSSIMMNAPLCISDVMSLNTVFILGTSAMSVNYWRRAVYGWRRTIDIITANIAGIIMFVKGILYIRYTPYVLIGFAGLLILVYSFYLSCVYSVMKRDSWWKYHLVFHTIAICELFIIIDSINDYNKNKLGMMIHREPRTFMSVICSPFINIP